jgi:sugar lactone lactonase YvrE
LQSMTAKTLVDVQGVLKFAKSPRWINQKLMFLDIHDRGIKSADMDGTVRTVMTMPYVPGGLGVLADGGLVTGDAFRRKVYRLDDASQVQMADLGNTAGYFLNDGIVDSNGGVYVADIGFDFLDPLVDPASSGSICYVSMDGKSSVVAEDLFFPGGMIITTDNKTLIVAEMLAHRLTAFEIESNGSLQNRRVWAQFQDEINPDGICLDCEGAVWVSGTGSRALRVREGGEIDQQITTERPVFAVMLGGPQCRHLFLCTSDSNDPVITRQVASATIDIVEVATPGSEIP